MAQIHTQTELEQNSLSKEELSIVKTYVEKNYKTFNPNNLIMYSTKSVVFIQNEQDSSPLILGKKVCLSR